MRSRRHWSLSTISRQALPLAQRSLSALSIPEEGPGRLEPSLVRSGGTTAPSLRSSEKGKKRKQKSKALEREEEKKWRRSDFQKTLSFFSE